MQIEQGTDTNRSSEFVVSTGSGTISSAFASASSAARTATPSSAATPQPTPASSDRGTSALGNRIQLTLPSSVAPSSLALSAPEASNTSTPAGKNEGGLSIGAKAGIGVGSSIAGLLLALSALFLGMSVRKKTRSTADTEATSDSGKPELDGTPVHRSEVAQLAGRETQTVAAHTELAAGKEAAGKEAAEKDAPVISPAIAELDASDQTRKVALGPVALIAEPRRTQIAAMENRQSPQKLHGAVPGSYILSIPDTQHSGVPMRDTYDDPRLVQNP